MHAQAEISLSCENAAGSYLQKFQQLLRELFQFDCQDLDFGIYRVLNYKRQNVEQFILERLPRIVDEALVQYASADQATAEHDLDQKRREIVSTLGATAFDAAGQLVSAFRETPLGKQFVGLEQKATEARVADQLQASVYNDLYTFLSRYYEDGDIFSRPRRGKVEIPFTGNEDVLLQWANRDQYYVKTGEQFKSYRFKVDDTPVEFVLGDVATERNDNSGEKRYFILAKGSATSIDDETKGITVTFEYRPLTDREKGTYGKTEAKRPQDNLNTAAMTAILNRVEDSRLKGRLAQPVGEDKPPLLMYHLTRFTRKNSTDFFIHKDLMGFLRRELEDFLKTEVVQGDELMAVEYPEVSRRVLLRAQVVRRIAENIIDFVAQVENFQKRLFEKRKFVVSCDYCITLDRLPEPLWDEVLKNEVQLSEWQRFGVISSSRKKTTKKPNRQFLKAHDKLVVDTRHFSEDFKWRLLAMFDDVDTELDGVLVKSENFQALELLRAKYEERVKCIYIDPPYNTGSDEFIYKDNYQHSCWLAMMLDRLFVGSEFLEAHGVFFTSIDDNEAASLRHVLDSVFGAHKFLSTLFVQVRYPEKTLTKDMLFHKLVEQIHAYARDKKGVIRERTKYDIAKFVWYVSEKAKPKSVIQLGGKKVEIFPAGTYEIKKTDPSEDGLKEIWATGKLLDGTSSGRFFRDFLAGRAAKDGRGVLYKVADIGDDKFEFRYFTGPKKATATKGKYYQGIPVGKLGGEGQIQELAIPNYFDLAGNFGNCRHEGGVELRSGKKPEALLEKLISIASRPGDLVLDFFVGSGTTCAVSQKMRRKWIGIEHGDYFDQKAKVRMQNVLNGEQTGVSGTYKWEGGGFFKYLILEQYEDSLNNLEPTRSRDAELALKMYGDEYLLRYMLDFETQGSASLLSLDQLRRPFAYRLKINDGKGIVERTVDLVETFNYLLGLQVKKLRELRDGQRVYRIALGDSRNGKRVLVVWRNVEDLEDNKQALQKDREFIESVVYPVLLGKNTRPDRLLANGPCAIEGAEAIEPQFHNLMFALVG